MDEVRIVVVDDSALFRTMLRNIVSDIPGCRVIASVGDGRSAISKIVELQPDLVTLDIEMPEMSGIDVLRELKKHQVRSNIVMVSRLTTAGAQVTTDALIEGAFDFILKPSGGNPSENKALLQAALTECISATREKDELPSEPAIVADESLVVQPTKIDLVVIGCSTGGPDALARVIPDLPKTIPVPIVIVQHMPERFTASLAARLNEASELEVLEASDGLTIRAGQVVLAKGGKHLQLERVTDQGGVLVRLSDAPAEHGCRPAVDFTLRSAANLPQKTVLAVILTGMGRDGMSGCEQIRAQGGRVIAQHAEGCTVYGMPKAVVQAGIAQQVIELDKIASAITRATRRSLIR